MHVQLGAILCTLARATGTFSFTRAILKYKFFFDNENGCQVCIYHFDTKQKFFHQNGVIRQVQGKHHLSQLLLWNWSSLFVRLMFATRFFMATMLEQWCNSSNQCCNAVSRRIVVANRPRNITFTWLTCFGYGAKKIPSSLK